MDLSICILDTFSKNDPDFHTYNRTKEPSTIENNMKIWYGHHDRKTAEINPVNLVPNYKNLELNFQSLMSTSLLKLAYHATGKNLF